MKIFRNIILLVVVGVLAVGLLNRLNAQQDSTIYDRDVEIVEMDELLYPTLAQSAAVQGVVVVKVALAQDGRVISAFPLSGGDKLLIDLSLQNARKARFRPNTQKSAIVVYGFKLDSGVCVVPRSFFQLIRPNFVLVTGCKMIPGI